MTDPVLHLLAGPNGAGKSTFHADVLGPVTHLEFVNADIIAAQEWPGDELRHSYDAAALATERRDELISLRRSFVTETVFSHPSKVQLLRDAEAAGYRTSLHIVAIPVELSVARVRIRARLGGHDVPEDKIRGRHCRLWTHLADAVGVVDDAFLYDNTRADVPYRRIARWVSGARIVESEWPRWLPDAIRIAGR